MKPEDNYYEILGIATNASQEEITRVFKQALQELSGDLTEAAGRRNQLEKAYYILGDEMRRFEYDRIMFNKKTPEPKIEYKPPSSEPAKDRSAFRHHPPLSQRDPYYDRFTSASRDRKQGSDKRPSTWVLVGLFLFVFLVGKVWLPEDVPNSGLKSLSAVNPDSYMPQPDIPPLELPLGGEVHYYTAGEPLAPLSINTAAGSNYFIKLVDRNTGAQVMTLFVRGGEWVETKVPLGNYELSYASGQDWYGEEHLFGAGTICAKADPEFRFYQDDTSIMGHTLSLIKQADGNLHTRRITAKEF